MRDLCRPIYRVALSLYPFAFRQRFADEMLDTYDLAAEDYSRCSLMIDLGCSVFRQRFEWCFGQSRHARRPSQTVLGSVLTGEYPGMAAEMPGGTRLMQAAVLIALLLTVAINAGTAYHATLHAGEKLSVVGLPSSCADHNCLDNKDIHKN